MRRVIVDQIEALAELNRIVARHGRGLDAAEPQQRRAPEPAYAAAGGRAAAHGSRAAHGAAGMAAAADAAAPRRHHRRRRRCRRRAAPKSPSLTPAPGQGNGATAGCPSCCTAPRKPDASASAAANARRATRWSRSNSLSVDIARMIDHDAAAELWDRYKRGERNVFTKRLYTMQGQKTFDEIRKKYRGDREFKQTVDRYIGEFERLLEEVSRDDRGQVVARTYLTSETGKVYTMLAHAAGRFGE